MSRSKFERGFELSVSFVRCAPDETVVALVRRVARRRAFRRVSARVEHVGEGSYRVLVHDGTFGQCFEHPDAATAVCGAFDRLEREVLMGWPYAGVEAAE